MIKRVYTAKELLDNLKDLRNKFFKLAEEVPASIECKWGAKRNYVGKKDDTVKVLNVNNEVDYIYVTCSSEKYAFSDKIYLFLPLDYKFKVPTKKEVTRCTNIELSYKKKNISTTTKVNYYIGSDPEVFVVDGKNELIPAFTFLKAKTDNNVDRTSGTGIYVESNPVYWDGFQAEFETTADFCLSYHCDSIRLGLKRVLELARKKDPEAKLSIKNVFDVHPDILRTVDEKFVQLGCMPSKNAYGMEGEPITNGRELPVRSTGGHIHFGFGEHYNSVTLEEAQAKLPEMVKALDSILGVACVSLFQNYDNPARRRYYGLAGEYRTPPHGLEYRVLSNAWLVHPFFTNLVFDVSRIAAAIGYHDLLQCWKVKEKETIECINTCDVKKAQEILERNKKMFIDILKACYPYFEQAKYNKLFDIFIKGMDSVLKNTDDIEANWNLTQGTWIVHNETPGKCIKEAIGNVVANQKVS